MSGKVKIGVFGAYRGMAMIRVLAKHPEAELVAVCDKYQPALEKVRALAQEAGIEVALYTSFDEFEKHDMDAVVLANYANEHAIYAIRLLKSGRHVLSEVLPCETMAQAVEALRTRPAKSGKIRTISRISSERSLRKGEQPPFGRICACRKSIWSAADR